MTEYISKDQLHEITKPFKDSFLSFLTDEIDKLVDAMKPADVQPVKHGQWILDNPQYLLSHCSECKCFNSIGYKWKYCPNCGARMS